MQDSATIRKYIRHPSDMPIQIALVEGNDKLDEATGETLTNISLGGLSFISQTLLSVPQRVRVFIPVLDQQHYLIGTAVWCEKSHNGYVIGLEFAKSRDMFRLRMIEQICHIEHYRKEVARIEGRNIDTEAAAREWIAQYAANFPAL